jgi:hypothetical protein
VKSERLLKFLLVANAPEDYGKRDLPPIRPEDEPGRKEFVAKHNAMVREDAELNQAFQDWVLCSRAERNGRVPPCTQGRKCTIYGCGGKGLLCGTLSGKASLEGKAESGKLKSEIGKASPPSERTLSAFGTESGNQMSEDRGQMSNPASEAGSAGEAVDGMAQGQRTEGRDQTAEHRGQTEEIPGLGPEGKGAQGEGLTREENALGERQAEIVAGKEAPQPPAGNVEGAGVAGNVPKEEVLPGGENPEREKEPRRYDPYEVSRKIRVAEKARRMRRRQIEM